MYQFEKARLYADGEVSMGKISIASGMMSAVIIIAILGFFGGCMQDAATQETMTMKEVKTIDGFMPTFFANNGELVFHRSSGNGNIKTFALKDNQEKEVPLGELPSFLAKGGDPYILEGEVYLKGGRKPSVKGLNDFEYICASQSGEKILLLKPAKEEGKYEFYLYKEKDKRLEKIDVSSEYYPENPIWVSEEEILFDAAVGSPGTDAADGPRSIYALRVNKKNKEEKPRLVLKDHYTPSLSSRGNFLACFKSEGDYNRVIIYNFKTMGKVASRRCANADSFFIYPVAWLSEDRFAVTETEHTLNDFINKVKIYEITKK